MTKEAIKLSQFAPGTFIATTIRGHRYAIQCIGANRGYVTMRSSDPVEFPITEGLFHGRPMLHGVYALNGDGRAEDRLLFGQPLWIEPDRHAGYATDPIISVASEGRLLMGCTKLTAGALFLVGCLFALFCILTGIAGFSLLAQGKYADAGFAALTACGLLLPSTYFIRRYLWVWL